MAPPGRGLEDVHAPQRRRTEAFINADHAPVKGKYPVGRVEGGRDHPRPAHHPPARELGGADGRGLRRAVARQRRAWRSRPARTTPRGACWRRRSRSARSPPAAEARKRYVARMVDQGAEDRRQARRAGLDGGAVDGRVRQHDDRRAGAAEDRGEAAVGQEVPLRRASRTPTRTSGRSWTSATTSCGPRRRTRS